MVTFLQGVTVICNEEGKIRDLPENFRMMGETIHGATEFRLVEMQKIKEVFPACSMDYLFESDGLIGEEEE